MSPAPEARECAEIHARDDRERSQRSDQQFVQVVARHVFHDAPAAFCHEPSPVTNSMPRQ